MEQAGQKPTNKNSYYEDGQWWYVGCKDGGKRLLANRVADNKSRMWVNGKYISKSHPLYKPGRYKSFGDAAFSGLENYESSTLGQVYIIVNPAFPGWCKVGMAVDSEDRLKQYQTSSPYRDYKLIKSYDTDDRRGSERAAHALLEKTHERKGEWFYIQHPVATEILNGYFNEND